MAAQEGAALLLGVFIYRPLNVDRNEGHHRRLHRYLQGYKGASFIKIKGTVAHSPLPYCPLAFNILTQDENER